MIKIKEVGFYLGLVASIIAIVDGLSDSINILLYVINAIIFLYFSLIELLNLFIDFFRFEIPIWFIIFVLFLILLIFKIKGNFFDLNNDSLTKQYNSFSNNEKNIFNIVSISNEDRKKCTYLHVLKKNKEQLKISNLEVKHILKKLADNDYIYLQKESMDYPHYKLNPEKGRELAILLMNNKKDSQSIA